MQSHPKRSRATTSVNRRTPLHFDSGVHGCGGRNRRLRVGQGRDGGIGVFQSKTRAVGDNFTCFGGRRWDEYLRRNIRTYSSMSREVLSALRITHVVKHNDVSESGFTTTPSA
jgi:hypothetical protein